MTTEKEFDFDTITSPSWIRDLSVLTEDDRFTLPYYTSVFSKLNTDTTTNEVLVAYSKIILQYLFEEEPDKEWETRIVLMTDLWNWYREKHLVELDDDEKVNMASLFIAFDTNAKCQYLEEIHSTVNILQVPEILEFIIKEPENNLSATIKQYKLMLDEFVIKQALTEDKWNYKLTM